MFKYLAVSTVNAFFYVIFYFFVFLCLDINLKVFIILSVIIGGLSLIPVILWMNGLYLNIIKNAYFLKRDIVFKLIPLIIVFFYYILRSINYDNDFILNLFEYLFFFSILSQVVILYDFFKNTMSIIERANQLVKANNKHVNTDENNLLGFDYFLLMNLIIRYTNKKFYIVENTNNIDYKNISYMVLSGNRFLTVSYSKLMFIIDDKLITHESIYSLQQEFKKFLFDMDDNELDVLKMMQI